MARLFIIGNGFDLAHGFKTRYSNFRNWMMEQLIEAGVTMEQLEEVPEIPFSCMGNHGEEYDQKELTEPESDQTMSLSTSIILKHSKRYIAYRKPRCTIFTDIARRTANL